MPAPSPLVLLCLAAVLTAIGAILMIGPVVWFIVVSRVLTGRPALEHEPRRLPSWGFIDLVAIVAAAIGASLMLAAIVQVAGIDFIALAQADDNRGKLYLMAIESVGRLLAVAAVTGFILLRTGCNLQDLGFSGEHLLADVRLGAAAFCALAIPTFGIQMLLTQFWPSEHPLIESLKVDSTAQFLAIGMFAAVIAAPISEEFAFRVVFQGWLEKMFDPAAIFGPNYFASLFAGNRVDAGPIVPQDPNVVAAALAEPVPPRSIYLGPPLIDDVSPNPYASPTVLASAAPVPATEHGISPPVTNFPRWITDVLPILVSSSLFALMHFSHGPDFIPLFFLALGLGYLYRRTHRITPSLVVHFLLNLTSMLALFVSLSSEPPAAK